jgi:hypothetical protein
VSVLTFVGELVFTIDHHYGELTPTV